MKVYKAINQVQAEMAKKGIAKGQSNNFDNYKFRGIDDVLNALGPALSKAGLIIIPRVISRESTQRPTNKGGVQFHVVLNVEFDFISAEDGSKHTAIAYGEAMDRGDKTTPKAMTAAYKYMVLQAFCIPLEGSTDADSESPEDSAPKLSNPQIDTLRALIDKCPDGTLQRFLGHFKADSIGDIEPNKYDKAKKALENKISSIEAEA